MLNPDRKSVRFRFSFFQPREGQSRDRTRQKKQNGQNDHRKRTINWILWIFDYFIRKYKTDDYYKTTITFLMDYIIAHESDWQIVDGFSPKNWYPASRGRINDMVHAGMG